jgi:hypothetical protein
MIEKLNQLQDDQAWQSLCEEARVKLVPELGATMGGLMDSCLTGYDAEAQYFDLVIPSKDQIGPPISPRSGSISLFPLCFNSSMRILLPWYCRFRDSWS